MYLLFHIIKNKPANLLFKLTTRSKSRRTHYDVLNLSRNCTTKEIKESFIKLSKEQHPDLNKDSDAHKKFLTISESYKVLSNAESRRNYDLGLISEKESVNNSPRVYTRYETHASSDPFFYSNRNKKQDAYYRQQPYYGIKDQKRVSNLKVVSIVICVAIFLVGLQFLAIAKSVTFQRDQLLRKSEEAQNTLKLLKKTAEENGNQVQLEILKSKFAKKYQKLQSVTKK